MMELATYAGRLQFRHLMLAGVVLLVSACSTFDADDRAKVEKLQLPAPPLLEAQPPAPPELPKAAAKPAPTKPKPLTQKQEAARLAGIADAVPRQETLKEWANRPYVNRGRRYVPMTRRKTFSQRGMASWYGRPFHGRKTAIGERYDMRTMTAAHPTLPLPSYVRVTSLETGRSIVVRVNDRGPFAKDRVIDLSFAAAAKLGFTDLGVTPVVVDLIVPAAENDSVAQAASQ